jgi:hypothetical protein
MQQYRSITYGFDSHLAELKSPIGIWGNYQSWRYPTLLESAGIKISFTIKNPTPWYLDLVEIAKSVHPIAIHMRRGDYVKYAADLGLLSEEYYLRALESLLDKNYSKCKEIWIFSDSIGPASSLKTRIESLLKTTQNRLLPSVVRVINPPSTSTSAENLLLLSQASAIITSNSSWSWWASWIAGVNTHVIVPQPYYKAYEGEFIDHIPDRWQRFPSEFI